MKRSRLASYLSSHRKRSGLSQERLGKLLGYPDEGPVSRHERLRSVPPLRIALGYQAIFQIPVSELFPGVYKECVMEKRELIAYWYLKVAERLLNEDLGGARISLVDCIKFIQTNPRAFQTFAWDFRDIRSGSSESYQRLTGTFKTIFDNFVSYLQKTMSPEQQTEFENGNYTLTPQQPIVTEIAG